jgi:cysteine synthase A
VHPLRRAHCTPQQEACELTCARNGSLLQEKNPEVVSYLVDPPGSGLFHLVTKGVMFHPYVRARHYGLYAPDIACVLTGRPTLNRQDTMTVEPLSARSFYEGVGVNRQTENFTQVPHHSLAPSVVSRMGHGVCLIRERETQVERYDGAFQGSEQEGVAMAHHLLRHDGLFVGGSSALNCVGAVKLARKLGPGHTIGTHSLLGLAAGPSH